MMKYQSCHNSKNLIKTNQTTITTIAKEVITIRIKDSNNSNSKNQQQSKSSWKKKKMVQEDSNSSTAKLKMLQLIPKKSRNQTQNSKQCNFLKTISSFHSNIQNSNNNSNYRHQFLKKLNKKCLSLFFHQTKSSNKHNWSLLLHVKMLITTYHIR